MINYKDNFIFNLLDADLIRAFSGKMSAFLYDNRIKELFRKQLSLEKTPIKYYFTDTTMDRVLPIDLTNCYPTKLGYLFDKYHDEIGLCITKLDNIGFIYHIGLNDIKIIITSGTNKTAKLYLDKSGKTNYAPLMKTVVGSAIISYSSNNVELLPNNRLSMILNNKIENVSKDREAKLDTMRLLNAMKKIKNKKIADITKNDDPYLFNTIEDINIKSEKIWMAIKMFIFLKTATVVDKTFISDEKLSTVKNNTKTNTNNDGIIVVDSTWDSSAHVINPFSVSGHFREQPKKNEKKEWYKEMIYIDAFMKTGYNRKAKIDQ